MRVFTGWFKESLAKMIFREGNLRKGLRGLIIKYSYAEDFIPKAGAKERDIKKKKKRV